MPPTDHHDPTPNVLFVVMDTARAQTVHAGLDDGLMPATARLAEEGVRFDAAISTAPWTLPSHASMFTGQRTSDHGVHSGNRSFDPDVTPLATRLAEHGYRTAGISGNVWVSPGFGFTQGFDEFSMSWGLFWDGIDLTSALKDGVSTAAIRELVREHPVTELPKGFVGGLFTKFVAGRHDDGAKRTVDRTLSWLDRTAEETAPFFYFLNFIEPHLPYAPPEAFRERHWPDHLDPDILDGVSQDPWPYIVGETDISAEQFEGLRALYRAELAYLDSQLDRLFEGLRERGVLDDTMVVVVGDHGENVGDHGLMDHQYSLHETLVHVPLLVRYPDRVEPGTVVEDPVEVRDLFPTVLSVAGVDPPETDGVSQNVLVTEDGEYGTRERAVSEYVVPQPSMESLQESTGVALAELDRFDRALRSVRERRWKFVEATDGSTVLYDLDADPGETTDISADHEDVVERLRSTVHDAHGAIARGEKRSVDVDEASRKRLEDLGYI
ncbi:sulfatase [Halomarina salina]|uniref:Sulfatase n=1 Tax=Halomarina salina TaxID=1872699 RepID=A0ABD5RH06_9EURY|nr:sulfatase [Halomarina salina]